MNTYFRLPLLPLGREFEWLIGSPAESLPTGWEPGLPAMNMWSDAEAIHVEAEVPGLALEQLEVSVAGDRLTLSGERPEVLEPGVAQHCRERAAGRFSRVVTLPYEVESSQVEARLVNGVLSIDLPKAQAVRPRRIEVKSSN